jgi:hypothetical protein
MVCCATKRASPARRRSPRQRGAQVVTLRPALAGVGSVLSRRIRRTHRTGRAMAKAMGLLWVRRSASGGRTSCRFTGCVPSSARASRLCRQAHRQLGLYIDPPAHAAVLSIDEKSQIQALDCAQPRLPIKPGRCQTMTHDYNRYGTTTPFAALSVLDGTVIGCCMRRSRGRQADPCCARHRRHPQASQKPAPAKAGAWPGRRAIHAGSSTSPRPPAS